MIVKGEYEIRWTAEAAIEEAKRLIAEDGTRREVIRTVSGAYWIARPEAVFFDPADEWTLVWPKVEG